MDAPGGRDESASSPRASASDRAALRRILASAREGSGPAPPQVQAAPQPHERAQVPLWCDERRGEKECPVRTIQTLGLLMAVPCALAGELILHDEGREYPVVTLMDPVRTDPYIYRWVGVNSIDASFSVLVDREVGSVLLCTGPMKTSDGKPDGECAIVFEGPTKAVVGKKRKFTGH